MNVEMITNDIDVCSKKKLSKLNIESSNYIVKLATSPEELDAAFKVRFEVFNLELNKGLQSSYKYLRDTDEFDKQCHHLIVIHKSIKKVVATCRIQFYEDSVKGLGFYSNQEFKLNKIPLNVLKNSIELGRMCILKPYRKNKVLYLLWKGIAKFQKINNKQYLLGCCSLNSQDSLIGLKLWCQLHAMGHIHSTYTLTARKGYELSIGPGEFLPNYEVDMPQLLKLYIKNGAKIIGPPAIDKAFKTIDFLVLLNTEDLQQSSKEMFYN